MYAQCGKLYKYNLVDDNCTLATDWRYTFEKIIQLTLKIHEKRQQPALSPRRQAHNTM